MDTENKLYALVQKGYFNSIKETYGEDCDIESNKFAPLIGTAIKYIDENYLSISKINEVSNHCYISESYLCRIFRRQLGISPIDVINSRKIIHAKKLLGNGYDVTDTCFASGFNSYCYFIALFKKATGMTPAKYRKAL